MSKVLINWVKENLAHGYSSEELRDFLAKEGYGLDEISEAIKMGSKKNIISKNKLILLFIVLFVILTSGGVFLYFYQNKNIDNTKSVENEIDSKATAKEENGVIDCGNDFGCFIDAVKSSENSMATLIRDDNFMGILINTRIKYEFNNYDNNYKYIYRENIEEQELALSEDYIKLILEQNPEKTRSEIEAELNQSLDQSNIAGRKRVCKYNSQSAMLKYLEFLKESFENGRISLSSDSFYFADCEVTDPDGSKDFYPRKMDIGEKCNRGYDCKDYLDQNKTACMNNICKVVECIYGSDCSSGQFCLENSCKTENLIKEEYPINSIEKCGVEKAENTETGYYSWFNIGSGNSSIDICAECIMDSMCKTGYKCEGYECVAN